MPYSSNKLFTMYGTKKAVHDGGLCACFIMFSVAKVGKVFGTCKGKGEKKGIVGKIPLFPDKR